MFKTPQPICPYCSKPAQPIGSKEMDSHPGHSQGTPFLLVTCHSCQKVLGVVPVAPEKR